MFIDIEVNSLPDEVFKALEERFPDNGSDTAFTASEALFAIATSLQIPKNTTRGIAEFFGVKEFVISEIAKNVEHAKRGELVFDENNTSREKIELFGRAPSFSS